MLMDIVDLPLFQGTTPGPLPHGARDYVPVLQTRKGELDALTNVSSETWNRVMPWIRIAGRGRDGKPQETTVRGWAKSLQASVGSRYFFVDLLRLSPNRRIASGAGSKPILEVLHSALRKRGLRFIPVLPADAKKTQIRLVATAAALDGRGVALHYPLRELVTISGGNTARSLATKVTALAGC